ncbi:MAG: PAS domain-containing sensor histidine kinase [Planctomycetota bacterium]
MASDDQRQPGPDGNRERFLQSLIDTIPAPIFYKDIQGRYLGCNVAFAEFLGRPREEIIGKTVQQVWNRPSADTYAARDAEILREESARQVYEYRTTRADGSPRDVLFHKAPLHDENGRISGLVGVMMDITDRKNAERQLTDGRKQLSRLVSERTAELEETNRQLGSEVAERKRAEQKLQRTQEFIREALDALEDPFFIKDEQHRWIMLNRMSCELMGHPREELIGRNDYDLFPPEQAKVFWENDEKAFRQGRLVSEEDITWHDRLYHISTAKSVYKDPTTGKRYLVGTIRDVTDLKDTEAELRRSQERLRAILETTPDLVFVINSDGVYVDIFTSGSDLLLAPAEEMIGQRFQDLLPPNLADLCGRALDSALCTGQKQTIEYVLEDESGQPRWQSASVARFGYGNEDHAIVAVRDITERVEAERSARQSEQRLRIILESSPDLMFVLDPEGRYMDIFTAESDLLAAPAKELIGRTIHEVLPVEVASVCQGIVDAAIGTGELQTHEYDLILPSGEHRWFQARIARFEAEVGPRVIWTARDITDRVLAEQAARQSEARFQEALRHSQSILYRFSFVTGKYEYVSDSVEMYSGYTAEEYKELGAKAFLDSLHPDDRDEVRRQLLRQPMPENHDQLQAVLEYRRRSKSGEYRWFMDWATLFYEDGAVVAVAGSAYDITEQRRAQQELREAHAELEQRVQERTAELAASKERWRSIVETAPDYVLFVEPDGTVRYINRAYTGLPLDRVVGMKIEEFAAPEYHDLINGELRKVIEGAESSGCEALSAGITGQPRWFSVRFGPFRRDGEVIGATLIAQDITERKATEHALHDVQRRLMKVQEEERRRLASDLHDSVSQMLFALQMRLKRLYRQCDRCARQQDLETAIDQCNQLIHETRAVYRGLYPPGLVQLGLVSALRQLARDFEQTTDINVTCGEIVQNSRFDDTIEIALFRIAQEAVRNAVRHGRAETVEIDLVMSEEDLTLRIADDGNGFEVTRPNSTSLGLRTMQERAVSIGGTFSLESSPTGTTVEVSVPAQPPPAIREP